MTAYDSVCVFAGTGIEEINPVGDPCTVPVGPSKEKPVGIGQSRGHQSASGLSILGLNGDLTQVETAEFKSVGTHTGGIVTKLLGVYSDRQALQ